MRNVYIFIFPLSWSWQNQMGEKSDVTYFPRQSILATLDWKCDNSCVVASSELNVVKPHPDSTDEADLVF